MTSVDVCPDNYDVLEALQAVELPCSLHAQSLARVYCKEQCLTLCAECLNRHNCPDDVVLETTDITLLLQQELGNEPKTAHWDNRAKLTAIQNRRKGVKSAVEVKKEQQLIRFRELLPTRAELVDYGWKLSINPRRIEAVLIRVSKDLVLTGVGIARPIDSQKPTIVTYIRIYKGAEQIYNSSNVPLSYLSNSKEQKVQIAPILPLVEGESYTLKMKIQGSSLYNGRPRSRISPLIGEDGAVWTLLPTQLHFPEVLSGPSWLGGPLLSLYYSS